MWSSAPRLLTTNGVVITERGERESCLGRVLQVKLHAPGYRPLSWDELWAAFAEAYPGRWAVQCFPPAGELVNGKAVYHLFVCPEAPWGLNIRG